MPRKQFVVATLAGGVTLFFLGFLIWGLTFASFFAANGGSATGVIRDPMEIWALALGQIVMAAFLTIVLTWAGASSARDGLRAGAIVGLFVALSFDLTMYATTNVANLTATMVDPILGMIQMAGGGAVIGAMLGRSG